MALIPTVRPYNQLNIMREMPIAIPAVMNATAVLIPLLPAVPPADTLVPLMLKTVKPAGQEQAQIPAPRAITTARRPARPVQDIRTGKPQPRSGTTPVITVTTSVTRLTAGNPGAAQADVVVRK